MTSVNGLDGIIAAETAISLVDGEQGRLIYRGHFAKELALHRDFEEVAYLLWYGQLPNREQHQAFCGKLANERELPVYTKQIIDRLPPTADAMSVLRTAVSSLGAGMAWPPTIAEAISITAKIPTIIAYREARLSGKEPLSPRTDLSHTANYLYMLHGAESSPEFVQALTAYWVLAMEHGMNASTFTARVVTSTNSDLVSALTGAIGTMKGPLHGGAPTEVFSMLDDIGAKEHAEEWLRNALERGERLMGFGHRVYRTYDPRADALRSIVAAYAQADPWFALAQHVEEVAVRLLKEYKPRKPLYTNVEFYAAAILRAVRLPKTVYPATFTASRVVGWSAHILEQAGHNRLIRPDSHYVGPLPS